MIQNLFIVCLVLIWLASPAHAETSSFHAVRYYEVVWNGLHIGDMVAEVKEENGIYRTEIVLRSRDIVKLFSPYRNTATATSKYDTKNGFTPVSFDNTVKLRKKSRQVTMHFAEDGALQTLAVVPPELPSRRPPVATSLLTGSIDPLTAPLRVREHLRAGKSKFTTTIYDGRKLFAIHYTVHGKITTEINGKNIPTIHITMTREPIAGFTVKEMNNMPKQNPVIDVYVDEVNMLPVKAIGKAGIGSATALLKKECASMQACLKP